MCPVLRKRNTRNVDKEKHVTGVSAEVALTYICDGNYVDVTSGYARVTCFSLSTLRTLRLRTLRHIVPSSGFVLIQSWPRCGLTLFTSFDHVAKTLFQTPKRSIVVVNYLESSSLPRITNRLNA